MNQLKPCPFCGCNDIEVKQYYNDGWYWFVTCKNCKSEKIHQFKGVAIQQWNTRYAEEAMNKELIEQAANYENIICEYKRDVKQAVEKIDSLTAEIERLKVALNDMCELWESMGKQIPPLLNEQKYLNAKALAGKDSNVPVNDTDKNLRERM